MLIVILSNHSHRSQRLTIPNLKLEIRTKSRYSLHSATQSVAISRAGAVSIKSRYRALAKCSRVYGDLSHDQRRTEAPSRDEPAMQSGSIPKIVNFMSAWQKSLVRRIQMILNEI